MRAALAVTLLCGCTNWTNLECNVRMACSDDAGSADAGDIAVSLPIDLVAAIAAPSDQPVVGLARGSHSWFLAVPNTVYQSDAGPLVLTFQGNVVALDAAGSPSRLWFATSISSSAGGVWGLEEADGGTFSYPSVITTWVPQTLTAYQESDDSIAASVFGGLPIQVEGFSGLALGGGQLDCRFQGAPDSAAIDHLGAAAVVGPTSDCAALTDAGAFVGYAAALFPRGATDNVIIPLVGEMSPGRARVGSNGDTAVAVMETGDGIGAVRLHMLTNDGLAVMVLHIEGAGANPRGFLDDVEQYASPDLFIVSLSNHQSGTVQIFSADRRLSFPLAPGSTALIALDWLRGLEPVTAWTLEGGAPDDIHLKTDPANTDVWLAASCRADAGASVPCAIGPARKVVLRLPHL
jgi:hypothetical protein